MIKLFTHNDLDGIGCEIVAKHYFGKDKVDVEVCGYNDVNEKFVAFLDEGGYKKYKKVYMTDISISHDLADRVSELDINNFELYDHHKTALFLNNYSFAEVHEMLNDAQKTSGTWLFYKIINPVNDGCCNFFNMIRIYDTWEWKEKNIKAPKYLNDLFKFYGREDFVNISLCNLEKYNENFVYDYIDLILKINKNIEKYCEEKNKKMKVLHEKGYKIGYVCAENNISELGNYLCENNNIDFAMININNESMSLRTIKDIDLSEIAKENGGGGHPKASGFRIKHPNIDFTIN